MQHRKDVLKLAGEYGHDVTGDSLSPVYREWRDALVSWRTDTDEPEEIRKQEETLQKLNAKTWGVEFCAGREQEIPCPSVRGNQRR